MKNFYKNLKPHNQRKKKDGDLPLGKRLDSRNIAEAENLQRQRTVNVDNHSADIPKFTKTLGRMGK